MKLRLVNLSSLVFGCGDPSGYDDQRCMLSS
jgi:hypothetical protein